VKPASADSTGSKGDESLSQAGGAKSMHLKEPHHPIKIGGYSKSFIKKANLFGSIPAYVKTGMWKHMSETEHPWLKVRGTIASYDLSWHKMIHNRNAPSHCSCIWIILEGTNQQLDYVGTAEKVIGIQEPDQIASG
jgi:hypothetical protein